MKTRSHRYDINRTRPRHGHKLVNIKCLHVLSNTSATFEAQLMKKLSNTEAERKKSVVYKKKRVVDTKNPNIYCNFLLPASFEKT